MEGSDEECHRTGTSCEGGESQRGVDILKVPLCGLVPVRRACVCVSECVLVNVCVKVLSEHVHN